MACRWTCVIAACLAHTNAWSAVRPAAAVRSWQAPVQTAAWPALRSVYRHRGTRMALDTGGAAIVCRGVDVWAGNNPLILDVNWSIMPGERWAIQGTNGCGKSTLLRAIGTAARGEMSESYGDGLLQVSSSLRMGMLEQTAVSGSDKSVREEVVSRMVRYQAAKQALDAATEECVIGSSEELDCLDKAQVEFEACGGYLIEAKTSSAAGARLPAGRV